MTSRHRPRPATRHPHPQPPPPPPTSNSPLGTDDPTDRRAQRLFELFGQSAIEINWCTRTSSRSKYVVVVYKQLTRRGLSGLTTAAVSEFRECKSLNGNVNRQNCGNLRAKTMTGGWRGQRFFKGRILRLPTTRIEFPVLFIIII